MSESSPEKKSEQEPVAPVAEPKEPKTVPVAVAAELRADKRALNEKVSELQAQLEAAKAATPQTLDMAALAKALSEYTVQTAQAVAQSATEAALQPLRHETELLRTAVAKGLNEPQVKLLAEFKAKYPGMDDDQALLLAKASKPDLFPQPRSMAPGLLIPSGGDSPLRSNPPVVDYAAKMKAATNWDEKREFAQKELVRIMGNVMARPS